MERGSPDSERKSTKIAFLTFFCIYSFIRNSSEEKEMKLERDTIASLRKEEFYKLIHKNGK
jgi:hypothetical protein